MVKVPLSYSLAAIWLMLWAPAGAQQALTGPAEIVDGDTLVVGGQILSLQGLDAPEADQTCGGGVAVSRCGDLATFALAGLVESHWLTCTSQAAAGSEMVATCRLGGANGVDLGAALVASGWALAVPGDATYGAQQDAARAARRGLWAGAFVAPWQWRAGRR